MRSIMCLNAIGGLLKFRLLLVSAKKFYCKTKPEAVKKKNEVLRELEKGTLANGPQRKLKDFLQDWLENVHKNNIVSVPM